MQDPKSPSPKRKKGRKEENKTSREIGKPYENWSHCLTANGVG
jgi:hypothetical protein